jgi:inner membrane protein
MDNLTHSLAGAILGQMGLKAKTGLAMTTLIIAANLPDIDAVAVLLGGHQHLALRRGLTHGPIAMAVLPIILWAAMLAWDKWRPSEKRLLVHKGWLLALAYIGTISHPALDWLNSYGVRLLEPFSSQWFYGDSIFIIDIWIWVALIAGVWTSRRREKRGNANWQKPAIVGFFALCAYIFANGVITGQAERITTEELMAFGGYENPTVVANPVPLKFWARDIQWRAEGKYGKGYFNLFPSSNSEANPYSPSNEVYLARKVRYYNSSNIERLKIGSLNPDVAAYLFWSRMPVLEHSDKEVMIRDQRFMDPRIGDRFLVRIPVAPKQ